MKHPSLDASLLGKILKFECFYLDPKQSAFSSSALERAAFDFWHSHWLETFREVGSIDVEHGLRSDDYVRHDEWIVISQEEEIVGLFGLNWYWTGSTIDRKSRYWTNFPIWISGYISELPDSILMSMSFLSVASKYRKATSGLPVSDFLVGLAVRRFLETQAVRLLTYTRNDRKTQELGHRHGAQTLDARHQVFGIDSDVLSFSRDSVVESLNSNTSEAIDLMHQNATLLSRSARTERALSINSVCSSSKFKQPGGSHVAVHRN